MTTPDGTHDIVNEVVNTGGGWVRPQKVVIPPLARIPAAGSSAATPTGHDNQ